MEDRCWESHLRGSITVNGQSRGSHEESRRWVREDCPNGEAVGDLVRTLVSTVYNPNDLPLTIEVTIEALDGHGRVLSLQPESGD